MTQLECRQCKTSVSSDEGGLCKLCAFIKERDECFDLVVELLATRIEEKPIYDKLRPFAKLRIQEYRYKGRGPSLDPSTARC